MGPGNARVAGGRSQCTWVSTFPLLPVLVGRTGLLGLPVRAGRCYRGGAYYKITTAVALTLLYNLYYGRGLEDSVGGNMGALGRDIRILAFWDCENEPFQSLQSPS